MVAPAKGAGCASHSAGRTNPVQGVTRSHRVSAFRVLGLLFAGTVAALRARRNEGTQRKEMTVKRVSKNSRTVHLGKQTIRRLTAEHLAQAVGGGSVPISRDSETVPVYR